MRKRVYDIEGKASVTVSFPEQFHAMVSSLFEEQDALVANCQELTSEVQFIPVLAKEANSQRARVVELDRASRTKASKVEDKPRTAGKEAVAEQARAERVGYISWISYLNSALHELKSKLEILERRNSSACFAVFYAFL